MSQFCSSKSSLNIFCLAIILLVSVQFFQQSIFGQEPDKQKNKPDNLITKDLRVSKNVLAKEKIIPKTLSTAELSGILQDSANGCPFTINEVLKESGLRQFGIAMKFQAS